MENLFPEVSIFHQLLQWLSSFNYCHLGSLLSPSQHKFINRSENTDNVILRNRHLAKVYLIISKFSQYLHLTCHIYIYPCGNQSKPGSGQQITLGTASGEKMLTQLQQLKLFWPLIWSDFCEILDKLQHLSGFGGFFICGHSLFSSVYRKLNWKLSSDTTWPRQAEFSRSSTWSISNNMSK